MKIAILVIGYNRLEGIKRLVKALERANYDGDYPVLIFSIDKSDKEEIAQFASNYSCQFAEKRIRTFKENQGLKKHILSCGEYFSEFDELIILEDDVYVSPSFYLFAKKCGIKYSDDSNIAGISLYTHLFSMDARRPFMPLHSNSDVFFMKYAQSWGQVWLKKSWIEFKNWYDKNNESFLEHDDLPDNVCHWSEKSWLKYHIRYCVEKNKYFVYPYVAKATCFADIGVHSHVETTKLQVPLDFGLTKEYKLIDFDRHDKNCIIYDQFYENESLDKVVGVECEIDLYGRRKKYKKRYVITSKHLNYTILKSWGMCLKPLEANIIEDVHGYAIYLYDTTSKSRNIYKCDPEKQWTYFFRTDGLTIEELQFCIKQLLKRFISKLLNYPKKVSAQ